MILSDNRNWQEFGPRVPYSRPIPIPPALITDPPLLYVAANESWLPVLNGAWKQLLQEEVWDRDDDGIRQQAIYDVDYLITSWRSISFLTPPQTYLKPFCLTAPAGLPADANVYDGATEQYFRVSTGYNIEANYDEAEIFLCAWDRELDSASNALLYELQIRIITADIPFFGSVLVQWRYAEDGGGLHSATFNAYIITRSTLGLPTPCHLIDIYADTDDGPLWWFIKTGRSTTEP